MCSRNDMHAVNEHQNHKTHTHKSRYNNFYTDTLTVCQLTWLAFICHRFCPILSTLLLPTAIRQMLMKYANVSLKLIGTLDIFFIELLGTSRTLLCGSSRHSPKF